MEASSEYAIVYLLPEPAWSYYLDLWAKLEREFRLTGDSRPNIPPHITLKYIFSADTVDEVEQALAVFSQETAPAPWSIRGFNHFITPDSYVIFLEVIATTAARAIHSALLACMRPIQGLQWDVYDNADLHFHATLAHRALTRANFNEVWSFVNAQEPPAFDLSLDTLTLLKIDGPVHTVHKTFRLVGGVDSPAQTARYLGDIVLYSGR